MGLPDAALSQFPTDLAHEVLSELGSGPLGVLELGRLKGGSETGRLVAVRRIPVEIAGVDPLPTASELGALAGRVRHPSLAKVLGIYAAEGELRVVSEYVEGIDLRALAAHCEEQETPLAPAVAVRIVLDALRAVHAAREQLSLSAGAQVKRRCGLFPDTIVVAAFGETLLTDVYVAGAVATCQPMFSDPELVRYLSPEELRAEAGVDERAEVFTAGVLLWELLANGPLFRCADAPKTQTCVLSAPTPRLDHIEGAEARIPQQLADLVERALQRPRSARFESLEEMLGALAALPRDLVGTENLVAISVAPVCGKRLELLRALTGTPLHSNSRSLLPSAVPTGRPRADDADVDESFWDAPTFSMRQKSGAVGVISGAFRVPPAPRLASEWLALDNTPAVLRSPPRSSQPTVPDEPLEPNAVTPQETQETAEETGESSANTIPVPEHAERDARVTAPDSIALDAHATLPDAEAPDSNAVAPLEIGAMPSAKGSTRRVLGVALLLTLVFGAVLLIFAQPVRMVANDVRTTLVRAALWHAKTPPAEKPTPAAAEPTVVTGAQPTADAQQENGGQALPGVSGVLPPPDPALAPSSSARSKRGTRVRPDRLPIAPPPAHRLHKPAHTDRYGI